MGMPFSPGRFNALLSQMGQRVGWKEAAPCPCRNFDSGTGAAKQGCRQCKGVGTLWSAAVPAWSGVQSMKPNRERADSGGWMAGDVILSVPSASPLWSAGEHDLVVMEDSSEPFRGVLEHDGEPRLAFPVVKLERCLYLRPGDEELVEAALPQVAADGTLHWLAGDDAPEPGRQFTITGRRKPTYFIFDALPQDRAHFGGLPLPRKIQGRRFDLFGRGVAAPFGSA